MSAEETSARTGDLPKIGAPALRALLGAKITSLSQLSRHTQQEIMDLHGMGPKAIGILRAALGKKGLSFKKSSAR